MGSLKELHASSRMWLRLSVPLIVFCFTQVLAQLSPGELSESHAFLEGLDNCKQCHGSDRKEIARNCLNCHGFIDTELKNRSGLHGRNEYAECELCHAEHHGRDFQLVYWQNGVEKFDHSQTGYTLDGKHARVECRTCHNAANVVEKEKLVKAKKDFDKTYLGLSQKCATCHFDEHRAQLGSDCQNCHTTLGWKPAGGFNHDKAKFTLTGKHVEVECAKCHPSLIDIASVTDTSYAHFTGLQFGECSACHKDSHQGRLGPNCSGCHSTTGWRTVNNAKFDHDKTKYPLRGKHKQLACEKCHRSGETRGKLAFGSCTDCHRDFHEGDFAKSDNKGRCESCHNVEGFRPAQFTVAQHDSSDFPLAGAHQAVPCNACHYNEKASSRQRAYNFRFEKHDCQACHKDPHDGKVNNWMADGNCQSCHDQASWRSITFDHSKTEFVLIGKHEQATCRGCHWNSASKWSVRDLYFKFPEQKCQDCHKDIHRDQFVTDEVTRCEQCHSPQGWKSLKFDHNLQSRFKLVGAHAKVQCAGCHKSQTVDTVEFIRYKPLGMACIDCHDNNVQLDSL